MPIMILEEFGWDFNDQSKSRSTHDNMRLIYSTKPGKRIGIQQAPNFQVSEEREKVPAVERTAKNLQGRIMENINRMKVSMETFGGVLAVPADWGVGPFSLRNVLPVDPFHRMNNISVPSLVFQRGSLVSSERKPRRRSRILNRSK